MIGQMLYISEFSTNYPDQFEKTGPSAHLQNSFNRCKSTNDRLRLVLPFTI